MINASDKKELTTVQKEIVRQGKIRKYWILLDSESTIDIVADDSLLTNIRKVDKGKTCGVLLTVVHKIQI